MSETGSSSKPATVGGGAKKILYTLDTVRRIGPAKAAKALTSKNACKACALGMGGQLGGMTNEQGEFPSVCNKSVQAQSTDIQPAIPEEVFSHTISEFQELSPRELERLGRLNMPLLKEAGTNTYSPISWEDALNRAAEALERTDPDRSFFYSSGRSSNEASFLFQLLARVYGTNNVSNCSYYCHQATGVGLSTTIGTGTSTVELADLDQCDMIFVIGANPSSNHPRFIHKLKACRDRGGEVVVINPAKEPGLVKFALPKSPSSMLAGGSEIASYYLQPKIGEDMALLKGIGKAILENGWQADEFISQYTEGYDALNVDLASLSWDEVEQRSGVTRDKIQAVAKAYNKAKSAVFAWGMGITHHTHGVDNVEAIASLALLRGMIGRPGAGLLPLRGHSNVQGVGSVGVKPVLAEDVIARLEAAYDLKLPERQGLDTMAAMQAAASGVMDSAVIMGGNLYAANPNSNWSQDALNKIGFKLFLTTTLNQGHFYGVEDGEVIILPVTARDEEWEPTTQESMFNFVRYSEGGIDRLDNVRPESVILSDLATKLLPDCPIDFEAFKRHSHTREAIAEIVPDLAELSHIDEARKEFHIKNRLIHTPQFKTPTGKAQFKVSPLADKTTDAPFILSTLRSEGQFNSMIYEEKDSYRGVNTRWSVLMNEGDISELGISVGGKISVTSETGEMQDVTVFAFDVPRGNILAYYPEANALTSTLVDPRSKTPSFKYVPVWLNTHQE